MNEKLNAGAKVLGLASMLFSVVVLMACGGGTSSATSVKVSESEWNIAPDTAQVKAGTVTFNVTNAGTEPHEFLVIKSDLPTDGLPLDASNNKVNEDILTIVVDSDIIAVGTPFKLSVKLDPGKYLFICNITENPPGQPVISHYQKGMRTAFTVS
jgi:uncharacterized cupredoxin-like copper-binding protein